MTVAVGSGCSVNDAFEQAQAVIELGEDAIPMLLALQCNPRQVFVVMGDYGQVHQRHLWTDLDEFNKR